MNEKNIDSMNLKELFDLKMILVNLRDDYFNELSGYDSRYLLDERNLTPHLRQIIEKKKNVDGVINRIKKRIEEIIYENFIK